MPVSQLIQNLNRLRIKLTAFFFRRTRVWVENKNTIFLAKALERFSRSYFEKTGRALPKFIRMQVDFCQLRNPLKKSNKLPEIEVMIPCTEKDFEILPFSLASVVENSMNPISKITLVTPEKSAFDAALLFPKLEVMTDENLLGNQLIIETQQLVPQARLGWSLQQLIKFEFTRNSRSAGVLIWDSDTLLVSPTIWLDDSGKQLLMFSHEYHKPYAVNTNLCWGPSGKSHGMSYVTHHQLMKPDFVREMFPLGKTSLTNWLKKCEWNSGSAFSEYHSYGTWVANSFPEKVVMGVWGNQSDYRRNFLGDVNSPKMTKNWAQKKHSEARSISLHDYLN